MTKLKLAAGFVAGAVLGTVITLFVPAIAVVEIPTPVITSVAPNSGPIEGNELVTITGDNLSDVFEVSFGGLSAVIQSVSLNSIVVLTPPHPAGFVTVTINAPDNDVSAVDAYEYVAPPPPTVTSLVPTAGPDTGGTQVIINGSALEGTDLVTFDGLEATIISVSDNQVIVETPPHENGFVDVSVSTPHGTTVISGGYEYTFTEPEPEPMPPSVTIIDPNEGFVAGGTTVVITGNNLDTVTSVTFDGLEATIVSATETELQVLSPAHPVGAVDVVVVNPDGSTTFEGGFTYIEEEEPEEPSYIFCNKKKKSKEWYVVSDGKHQKKKRALVCHKKPKKNIEKTLCLPLEAIPAHLGHGDSLGYCEGDDPKDDEKACAETDNITFYIPLTEEKSGDYPEYGSSSDSVTLTRDEPSSTGHVNLELSFEDVPSNLENPTLRINFDDLDLHGDTSGSRNKKITLHETFELKDASGNTLATLDETASEDDNFTWRLALPDGLISGDSLSLSAIFTSSTNLIKGSSMTISNGSEGIKNIKICSAGAPDDDDDDDDRDDDRDDDDDDDDDDKKSKKRWRFWRR